MTAKELIAEARRLDESVPRDWMRDTYEDGDEGEGPYGVYPGGPGPIVEGNEIVTKPTGEDGDSRWICQADNGQIAAFIPAARNILPDLATALDEALTAREGLEATNDRLQRRLAEAEVLLERAQADLAAAFRALDEAGANDGDSLALRIRDFCEAAETVYDDEEAAHQETLALLTAERKAHAATKARLAALTKAATLAHARWATDTHASLTTKAAMAAMLEIVRADIP